MVKICGLTRDGDVLDALEAGADWIGLICHARSPRWIDVRTARRLADLARNATHPAGVVMLVVNPDQATLDALIDAVSPDAVQFHGQEPDAMARSVLARGLEAWRAVPVGCTADIIEAQRRRDASRLLFDARPAPGADRAGGLGHSFDWSLLGGQTLDRPWLLAGGLKPATVAEAIRRTGAPAVDVSTGVERAPGQKDAGLMRAFIEAARSTARSTH